MSGAVAKHDVDSTTLQVLPKELDACLADHEGSKPMAIALKPFHLRHGPSQSPMVGVGSFYMCCGSVPVSIVALPISSILKEGISLKDVPAFLETASGVALVGSYAKIALLDLWYPLWVPCGWLVVPMACPDIKDKDRDEDDDEEETEAGKPTEAGKKTQTDACKTDEQKDEQTSDEIGYIFQFPVYSTKLRAKLDESDWKAIYTFNHEFFRKSHTNKLWGRALR